MSFASSNYERRWGGGFTNGAGSGWVGITADTTTQILATGYYAAAMAGSLGTQNIGMQVGDVVITKHAATTGASSAASISLIVSSTANSASTNVSSYAFNGTGILFTAL